MLSADKHSQISQISQLQMGENFSGATEISDAVWKIEVSNGTVAYFLTNLLQNILLDMINDQAINSILIP